MDRGISLRLQTGHERRRLRTFQEVTTVSQNVSVPHIKLSHQVIVKAPGLLPMMYTVHELAEELSMPERTLRDWLMHSAPYNRDARQRFWINGQEFASWVKAQHIQRERYKLADDEAYCLHCKRPVRLSNPVTIPVKARLIRIRGNCPVCNCVINRGGRNGKTRELPLS